VAAGSSVEEGSVGNGSGEGGSVGCETVGGTSIVGKSVGIRDVATGWFICGSGTSVSGTMVMIAAWSVG
jgi:hypothetical protein